MTQSARPQLAAARTPGRTLEAVRAITAGGTFDPDVFHVMEERDNTLIEQEILHGAGSSKFVYNFEIQGTQVTGISVIGARHLAAAYGGLKHRLVASVQKTGDLFTFTSYPDHGMPMQVSCSVIAELENEPDFYGAVCEIGDIKTGNSIQIERRENRYETAGRGTPRERTYERPHYATIAQSKAYRNAILSLIPQDIQLSWKIEMLKLKKDEVITGSVIDEKRANVLRFAAQRAIALDRRALEDLTFDQISGLGDAVRDGALPAFVEALKALGLDLQQGDPETGEIKESTSATVRDGNTQLVGARSAPTTQQTPGQDPATQTGKEPASVATTVSPNTTPTVDPARETSQTKPAEHRRRGAAGMFSE
jgi:hypothetical protein